jgi:tRNA (guanine-N1)-methyltransferase
LGNKDSIKEETHSINLKSKVQNSKSAKEYPQYTRPEEYMGMKVPKVLLSGDHKKIEEWRKKHTK